MGEAEKRLPGANEYGSDAIKVLNKEQGLTVFLVEQNAFAALKLSDRAYVMVNGRVTMSGSGKELLANFVGKGRAS